MKKAQTKKAAHVEPIRCENCRSTQVNTRIKTNERICYKCGHVQALAKQAAAA
jgi:hypothetical protein